MWQDPKGVAHITNEEASTTAPPERTPATDSRPGEHIEIGKTIGLVGSTGLSTGPHLDFRILWKGQYKNFEKLGLPPSDPVSKKNLPEFAALREKWLPVLKNPEIFQANAVSSGPSQGH